MFLTELDFTSHQRGYDLNILTKGQPSVREFAERATIEEVQAYLRVRYNVVKTFIEINEWNASITYDEDIHVIYDIGTPTDPDFRIFYSANTSTGSTPALASTDWILGDKRNSYLVMICVDVAVYHMHAKIPGRQTPQDVVDRYVDAMEWLGKVAKGELKPSFAEYENDDVGAPPILYGSTPKKTNDW